MPPLFMPAEDGRNAVLYSERLSLPLSWWVITAVIVLVGGAELWAGFNWRIALLVYLVLGGGAYALLRAMGRGQITLDAEGLHAGGRTLPLDDVAAARVLERQETRLRLGPGGDPRAHVVMRGWLKESVEVTPLHDAEVPYWLLSTRRADELVTALRSAVLAHRA
jgi:DUF3093 family protein